MSLKPWVDALRNPPIQYQKGWTEFYKLKFKLTPDVLIPRPETELLVDEVLNIVRDRHATLAMTSLRYHEMAKQSLKIIDMGTGSGTIAISVAKSIKNAKVFALDISEKALEVAGQNARFHKVENRVIFLKSDLLTVILGSSAPPESDLNEIATASPRNDKNIDIIVANLPYIPTAKLMLIDPMVRDFEPSLALDGGYDGFELYRKMFNQIAFHPKGGNLKPKYLICEIDEDQADLARLEVKRYFPDAEFEVKKDLAKKDRILIVKF